MVKIVNIFKAAGLWVGTIFLLYGNKPVSSSAALGYTGYGALAPSRSPMGGGGQQRELSFPHHWQSPLETKIGGQVGHGGKDKSGRFKTPVMERGGGF